MKQYLKILGKVCVTVDGDWDNTKEYERICIVRDVATMKSYISKKFVPVGIDILDEEYWQYLCNGSIINNLESTDAEAALSANMGRYLHSLIQELGRREAEDINSLNNKITNLQLEHHNDIDEIQAQHSQDFTRLNNQIKSNVSFTSEFTSGVKIGTLRIGDKTHDIYIPVWNGTLAQYNDISVKDSRFIYNIID